MALWSLKGAVKGRQGAALHTRMHTHNHPVAHAHLLGRGVVTNQSSAQNWSPPSLLPFPHPLSPSVYVHFLTDSLSWKKWSKRSSQHSLRHNIVNTQQQQQQKRCNTSSVFIFLKNGYQQEVSDAAEGSQVSFLLRSSKCVCLMSEQRWSEWQPGSMLRSATLLLSHVATANT